MPWLDSDPDVETARERYRESQPADEDAAGDAAEIICRPAGLDRITDIPPRRWAYGHYLLFGHAAVLGAVDGGGKGAIATAIACSMITGKPLLGEQVWRSGSVAIISYEDDEAEWCRRIAAACLHYEMDYESVIGNFHFLTRSASRICFAAQGPRGVIFPDSDGIIARLKSINPALLIVDPLNHSHGLEDGNSNVGIAKVAIEISRIASETGVAALVLHHLRKGSTGAADDLMGATSLRATFRSCRILARMDRKEAEALGIPPNEAWRHSRISGSKENYAPPPELATWYRLESIGLGNGQDIYSDGDNVQVTTTWQPPDAFKDLPRTVTAAIFNKIRSGPAADEFYSPDRRSKRWVGHIIADLAQKSDEAAGRILRTWLKNNVLLKDEYDDPERRESVGRVLVNEAKTAEILGPLYQDAE